MATHMDDIRFALRVEFERMRSLGRPLSVLALLRRDLFSFLLPEKMIEQTTAAIANNTRTYDSVGLLTDRLVLLVLPETDADGASMVAGRIRDDLALRNEGHHSWTVLEFTHVEQYGSADLLTHAIERSTRVNFLAA
jgi:hypothetical protein